MAAQISAGLPMCAGDDMVRFLSSGMSGNLLRFALQKTLGDLCLAHKLWDLMVLKQARPSSPRCACVSTALHAAI